MVGGGLPLPTIHLGRSLPEILGQTNPIGESDKKVSLDWFTGACVAFELSQ